MWNTFVKGMWSRKRRLLGTSVAVLLGVAFLVASLSLGDTLRAGFENMYADANAGTAVVVRNRTVIGTDDTRERGTLPAALEQRLAGVDGVAAVAAQLSGRAMILDAEGHGIGGSGPPTVGGNWVANPALNPYRIASGRAPHDVAAGQPYEVVIDRRSADEGRLALEAHTKVKLPEPVDVVVVGIVTFGTADSMGPVTFTGFADGAAETLLSRDGTVDSFRIAAEPGVSESALRAEVARILPSDAQALTGHELTAEQLKDVDSNFLGMFRGVMLAFAVVAVVVAAFSIHNTFAIVVAQRTRETALLRAVGASRRQVLGTVVGEAVAIGTVASALGVAAGYGLTTALKALMAGKGIDLGYDGIELGGRTIAIAAIVGIGVTIVSSVAPALKAARTAPLAALRDAAVDESGSSKLRAVAGALLTAGGIAVVVTATSSASGALGRAGLGAVLTLAGAVTLGPVIARPVAAVLGAPAASATHAGRLARGNAMRNPRRTAGSAAALVVGTAVVALFATFGSSIKASIDRTVDRDFAGDLIIVDDNFGGGGISSAVATDLAALPEVADVVGMSIGSVTVDGRAEAPSVLDPAALGRILDVDVASGSLDAVTAGHVAISAKYAGEHDLTVGSTVDVAYADGASTPMTVASVYRQRQTVGDVIMTPADWDTHSQRTDDVAVLIDLADGVSQARGVEAVTAVTDRHAAPKVETRDQYKATVAGDVDSMLAFVYGLLTIAVLIALLGIANTLSLSIHERTRELGLLRAIGQTRRQLRAAIRWESVITALFGTIVGLALGTFLGWGVIRALAAQEGVGLFAAPTATLVVILGLAVLAGVLAALRPARRAARLDILDALATS